MHLTSRDRLATLSVGTGALAYVIWLAGVGPEGITGVRAVAGLVLALGFAASASAVVPGFDGLVHGSKLYLAGTSLIGMGALGSGIGALLTGREPMLALLLAATVALWVASTVRHSRQAGSRQPALEVRQGSPEAG